MATWLLSQVNSQVGQAMYDLAQLGLLQFGLAQLSLYFHCSSVSLSGWDY